LIWTDGKSNPVFITDLTSVRSNWGLPLLFNTTTTAAFLIPAVGVEVSPAVGFTDVTDLAVGDLFTVPNRGILQVTSITPTVAPAGDVLFVNVNATPTGANVASGTVVSWQHIGTQLPPGRMGAYGMGRNAMSLIDGQQFVIADLVGGASGTQAENYRDSVLEITENLYLRGGGNFRVPGSPGDIRAMKFTATMDVSLGQGPLQVFTPGTVFSCQTPVDRALWAAVENPILTESVITNGGLSQDATVNVNSDILGRAIDGIRSIRLSRSETSTWGTTPISFEVSPQLDKDSETTLGRTSAIVFDNRFLLTTQPKVTEFGVYWQALIALNFDPVSSLRGKAPSVYDSLIWTGLNVFKLFVGQFGGVERAFAVCWNELLGKLELYELLKSAGAEIDDNDGNPRRVTWTFTSASLFKDYLNQKRKCKQLVDGEMWIDKAKGKVDVQVYWIPDQWPCPVPWISFSFCATETQGDKPGFEPIIGLGEPPAPMQDANGVWRFCDAKHDRPLRNFYNSQFKFVITGQCEFLGAALRCVTVPDMEFERPICQPVCETN